MKTNCIDKIGADKYNPNEGLYNNYLENRVILPEGKKLTVGKNINGKTTATLEDNNGNIAFPINSENINNVRKELENVKNWDDLKSFLKDNYGIDGDSLK